MSRDLRPFTQWSRPKSQVAVPASTNAYLMRDADSGVWGFTADQTEADGAFMLHASGVYGIDDAVITHEPGLRARLVGSTRALVYTVS